MSDMIELTEPPTPDTHVRDEIRATSDRVRARRLLRSRIMVTLCALALAATAVPLLLLLYQLFRRGLPVVLHGAFYTQLPQTPTLIAPNATGGVSNAILGTLVLALYASIMAIPVGVLVGIYLAESESKLAASLRVTAQTMAGAPSILMGLFAFSFVVQRPGRRILGHRRILRPGGPDAPGHRDLVRDRRARCAPHAARGRTRARGQAPQGFA